jgi:hypothetical protein
MLNTITNSFFFKYFSLGEEDDDYLLDYSNAIESVDPYTYKFYTEEETEQHVSPEARSVRILDWVAQTTIKFKRQLKLN